MAERMVLMAQAVIEQLNITERTQLLAWADETYGHRRRSNGTIVRGSAPVLTKRELQVLSALDSNRTYKQVADKLGISDKTVETYVGRLGGKFQVSGREEIVAAGRRARMLRVRKKPKR